MNAWLAAGSGASVIASLVGALVWSARWLAKKIDTAHDDPNSGLSFLMGVLGRAIGDRLAPQQAAELAKLAAGQAQLAAGQAQLAAELAGFGERLTGHLAWEERRDREDIEHRRERQVTNDAQWSEVRTRLSRLEAS